MILIGCHTFVSNSDRRLFTQLPEQISKLNLDTTVLSTTGGQKYMGAYNIGGALTVGWGDSAANSNFVGVLKFTF